MSGPGRLEAHLRARRDDGRKLLVPYMTGGVRDDWVDLVGAMVAAGADAVEIGFPFSDPAMDGPTIQEASSRALSRGTNAAAIMAELGRRRDDLDVPLVAMTYANVVFRMGARRFAAEATGAGISGVILPDVPLEELGAWSPAAEGAGLETVLLASPISPDDRLRRLVATSRGFCYGVNLLGVTGERATVGEQAAGLASRLKAMTDLPVLMGFGVSGGDQARALASVADGVIIASAIMRRVLDGAGPDEVGEFTAGLRAALDRG